MTRSSPKTPAPDDLDREQRAALLRWVQSRPHLYKYAKNRKLLRLQVDECLSHHKAKGTEFRDWVAACQKWIVKSERFATEYQTTEKPQEAGPRSATLAPLADTLELFH